MVYTSVTGEQFERRWDPGSNTRGLELERPFDGRDSDEGDSPDFGEL